MSQPTQGFQEKFNARRQEIFQAFQVFQQGLTGNVFMATQTLLQNVINSLNNLEQEALALMPKTAPPVDMTPKTEAPKAVKKEEPAAPKKE